MTPELAAQLVDPAHADLAAGSNVSVAWRCPQDPRHVWSASPNTRRRSPRCPVCLNKIVLAGVNDLTTTHPQLAAQLVDPTLASSVHAGSHATLEWQCADHGSHRWSTSVVSRTRLRSGCPYCSGRIPVPGETDLATTHPELAAQLVDATQASTVSAGSAKSLRWQCPIDPSHIWPAPVRNRSGAGRAKATGCPHCIGRAKREPARKPTLGQLCSPLLADAVDPSAAEGLSSGSGRVIAWRCRSCAQPHEYLMSVRHRVRGQGCPVKAGVQILIGFNDLASTHPQLAAELVDPDLGTTVSRGSVAVLEWRCAQGHTWTTPVYARVAGNGCPHCCPVGSSYGEQEVLEVARVLEPSAEHRVRTPGPGAKYFEVDVLVGTLAIEFNGTFWHSEVAGRASTSHAVKAEALRDAGFELLTVWEDDWADPQRRAILVTTIAHRLRRMDRLTEALKTAGIPDQFDQRFTQRRGARSLRLGPVDSATANAFFARTHVQGPVTLTQSFALFDETDQPRAIVGLRSPRHSARARRADGEWEIQRYATMGIIPGGFSRLVAYAAGELRAQGLTVNRWVSLAANESSQGALYAASGFAVDGTVPPSYWYSGGPLRSRRVPKESFQRRRFREDPALLWDESWTERIAAAKNGLYRVYDAGKTRWVKDIS